MISWNIVLPVLFAITTIMYVLFTLAKHGDSREIADLEKESSLSTPYSSENAIKSLQESFLRLIKYQMATLIFMLIIVVAANLLGILTLRECIIAAFLIFTLMVCAFMPE